MFFSSFPTFPIRVLVAVLTGSFPVQDGAIPEGYPQGPPGAAHAQAARVCILAGR
jgi:hypothetical protein